MRSAKIFICLAIVMWTLSGCEEEEEPKLYAKFELESPQLQLTKTIWLYLPGDYNNSTKSYPVIYMHDAQWIFESNSNYSQEMHVDEMLREMEHNGFEGAIVVGIESDENTRADEFGLYHNSVLGAGGKGQAYLDFIVQTLKPKIDNEYRTKGDRINTCVMGASLGGLSAFYALTQYPDVFGKATLFSAALHFNRDSVFRKASRHEVRVDTRIFAVVGKNEFNDQVNFPEDNQILFDILRGKKAAPENLLLEIHEDGEHRIWFWEREFPDAIEFLFK